jgi:Family of unknown function (DUF6496)
MTAAGILVAQLRVVREVTMPEKKTIERAKKAQRRGKSPSTQSGEFVREELHHIREGKHGARSTKQAIAIGLSKARRAGVDLPPPKGRVSEQTRRSAARAFAKGRRGNNETAPHRSRATERALKREGRSAASRKALSQQARSAARHRPRAARSASARQAARTKGRRERSIAARKGARKRARRV